MRLLSDAGSTPLSRMLLYVDMLIICSHQECSGISLGDSASCFRHAKSNDRDRLLADVRAGGPLWFTRGLTLDPSLLAAILAAVPYDSKGRRVFTQADFSSTSFQCEVDFANAIFIGTTHFRDACFGASASWHKAIFDGEVDYAGAVFGEDVLFSEAAFRGRVEDRSGGVHYKYVSADFSGAKFCGQALFVACTFELGAFFIGTSFADQTRFDRSNFKGRAQVQWGGLSHRRSSEIKWRYPARLLGVMTAFTGAALFIDADFGNTVHFDDCIFTESAVLVGATFRDAVSLMDIGVGGHLDLDGVVCMSDLSARAWVRDTATVNKASLLGRCWLELRAESFEATRLSVGSGGVIRLVTPGGVDFSEADFTSPVTVTGEVNYAIHRLGSQLYELGWRWIRPPQERTIICSIEGANVAGLTLTNVSLEGGTLLGAIALDRVKIGSSVEFAYAPSRGLDKSKGHRGKRRWLFHFPRIVLTATVRAISGRRRVIAEECTWRAARKEADWVAPAGRPFVYRDLNSSEVASVYRQLRKSLEDSKDEPGAADFYYGEMEMRRLGAPPLSASRALLSLYWATSGYGLRSLRPLVFLVGLVVYGTVLLGSFGLAQTMHHVYYPQAPTQNGPAVPAYREVDEPGKRPGWSQALVLSIESATSLLRPPVLGLPLTGLGEVTTIQLRLLGSVLIGLELVTIRNNVKR